VLDVVSILERFIFYPRIVTWAQLSNVARTELLRLFTPALRKRSSECCVDRLSQHDLSALARKTPSE